MIRLRQELSLTYLNIKTAVARTRAFGKWADLRTWISDLIKCPYKHRYDTWGTSSNKTTIIACFNLNEVSWQAPRGGVKTFKYKDSHLRYVKTTLATVKFLNAIALIRCLMLNNIRLVPIPANQCPPGSKADGRFSTNKLWEKPGIPKQTFERENANSGKKMKTNRQSDKFPNPNNIPFKAEMYSQLESQEDQEPHVAVSRYATMVPIRIDIEAALTYCFGGLSGVLFLVFERENDFIRFHAYQSTLLSLFSFCLTMIFGFLFGLYKFMAFVAISTQFYMAFRAYKDSATLDYFMLPSIGQIAYDWTASE
ncbi:hypothetical protein BB561_001770 [Smittium simulii]|uniref:Uncharacterized protein n=1 Tax=Smittium simulii TaxID=133385 RepID=A0A2T9YT69_9FUNG|nr:hypothetical protein BB561_001770 [Smittium simulii]